MSEPNGGGIILDGALYCLVRGTRVSVEKPQIESAKAFMTLRAPRGSLETIAGMRGEGEMGVQRDAHDFRDSVQRVFLVTNSHLWISQG